MDLPPDKAKLLKSYDDDKKWDLICDQVSWCSSLNMHEDKSEIYFRESYLNEYIL